MRNYIFAFSIILFSATSIKAQDVGLSFSFFFPKNGDFSTPISPFSIRGLGINFSDFLGVQTGFSLYRMTGMNVKGVEFESTKPLVGPNFTLLIPLELVIKLAGSSAELNLKGGGFFFYSFDQQLNYGNLDRAIRDYENLAVVNSDFNFDNSPGFGYQFGAEVVVFLSNGYGVSLEGNYYIGGSKLNLVGSYLGYDIAGNSRQENLNYPDAKVDFTGLEVAIGIIMSGGGGKPKQGKKRRRR